MKDEAHSPGKLDLFGCATPCKDRVDFEQQAQKLVGGGVRNSHAEVPQVYRES